MLEKIEMILAHHLQYKLFICNTYSNRMDKNERTMEFQEREEDLRLSTISNTQKKKTIIVDNLLNKDVLEKYSSNKLISIYHNFQKVFLKLLLINEQDYNQILVHIEFAQFYAKMVKNDYFMIISSIRTNTENLMLLMVKSLFIQPIII